METVRLVRFCRWMIGAYLIRFALWVIPNDRGRELLVEHLHEWGGDFVRWGGRP